MIQTEGDSVVAGRQQTDQNNIRNNSIKMNEFIHQAGLSYQLTEYTQTQVFRGMQLALQ